MIVCFIKPKSQEIICLLFSVYRFFDANDTLLFVGAGSSSWTKHDWVTSWMPDDRSKTTEATGEASHSFGTVSAPPTGERTTFGRMDWDNKEGLATDRGPESPAKEPPNTVSKLNDSQSANGNRPDSIGTKPPANWRPYTPHNTWYPSSKADDYKETNAIDEPNQQGLGSRPDNSVTNPLPPRDVMCITLLLVLVTR